MTSAMADTDVKSGRDLLTSVLASADGTSDLSRYSSGVGQVMYDDVMRMIDTKSSSLSTEASDEQLSARVESLTSENSRLASDNAKLSAENAYLASELARSKQLLSERERYHEQQLERQKADYDQRVREERAERRRYALEKTKAYIDEMCAWHYDESLTMPVDRDVVDNADYRDDELPLTFNIKSVEWKEFEESGDLYRWKLKHHLLPDEVEAAKRGLTVLEYLAGDAYSGEELESYYRTEVEAGMAPPGLM